jgi:hypothetical protein
MSTSIQADWQYFDLPALANEQTKSPGLDLTQGPDGIRSLNHDYWAHYSCIPPAIPIKPFASTPPFGTGTRFSTPTTSANISRVGSAAPRKLSLYDIHDQLEVLIQPLMTYIAVTSTRSDRYLHALLERLIKTESHLFPNTPDRTTVIDAQQNLLVGIDATRTLVRYLERDIYDKGTRPRIGEVAEAIESLGDLCLSVGLDEDVRIGCLALASAVRTS